MKRLIALAFLFLAASGHAAVSYISPSGNDTTGDGSSGNPWATINKWKTAEGGCGDTLILKAGTYTGNDNIFNPTNLPSCAAWSSSATIKAETLFTATFTATGSMALGGAANSTEATYYMKLEGIAWNYNDSKDISGHYIYIKNCKFIGGGTTGDTTNLLIGNNNFGAGKYGATNVLIEDVLVVGETTANGGSGRYGILMFNCDNTVVRRAFVHMNNGYTDTTGDPSANMNIYNSNDTYVLNSVAFDERTSPPDYYQAGLYGTSNSSTGAVDILKNSGYYGSIAFNITEYGLRTDGGANISSFTYRNVVSVDAAAGGAAFGSGSPTHVITLENFTLINASVTPTADGVSEFNAGGNKTIRNGIIAGFTAGDDFNGITASPAPSYIDCYNIGGTCDGGTGQVTYNPLTNGASTWMRIETGSNLKTAGSGGGQIGAEIVYRLGDDGDFFGDSGWSDPTATLLWPWPNEDEWKNTLCTTYSASFCAGTNTLSITEFLHARGVNVPAEYTGEGGGGGGGSTATNLSISGTGAFSGNLTIR